MNHLVAFIFNPYSIAYLLIVAGSQILYRRWRQKQRDHIATQRRTRGLPSTTLLYTTENLNSKKREAAIATILLLITVLTVPVLLVEIARVLESDTLSITVVQRHLALVVAILLLIALVSGRQAIQAFISGLAFKLIAVFTTPFELGDRITLHRGQHSGHDSALQGQVIQLSSFFITLKTLSGQQINVPTHTLWHAAITVINKPTQASLCKIAFYVSTHITSEQQKIAENFLLETVRSSAYVEPSQPIEVHCKQGLNAVQLIAVAYVAAIENTDAFTSDVTRQFLIFARQKQIPLSSQYVL